VALQLFWVVTRIIIHIYRGQSLTRLELAPFTYVIRAVVTSKLYWSKPQAGLVTRRHLAFFRAAAFSPYLDPCSAYSSLFTAKFELLRFEEENGHCSAEETSGLMVRPEKNMKGSPFF